VGTSMFPATKYMRQFTLFAFVGGLATGLQYTILILLVQLIGFDPVWASALGYLFSGIINYRLNYTFTFNSSNPHKKAFVKFATVSLVGLFLNTGIMALGINVFFLPYLLVQVFGTSIVLLWNFSANLIWTFR
jgi:putative flippase GtrA